ncbi:MAG: tetratricopeptide repeat protein [Phycisphaerae bacterium]|nr:tetratricopeptide repeat protein [Phycisphaerae bacterium]
MVPCRVVAGLFFTALLVLTGCGKPVASFDKLIQDGLGEYQAQRYPEALAMFEEAESFDRERPEPSFYMGRCYLAMAKERFHGDNLGAALRYCDRAIASYDKAIGAFPGFSLAVQGKADALKLKGQHAAALEVANWAAKVSGPQAKKLILKAHLYARTGDLDQAQLAFKQATSVEPDNAAAHAELGLFYLRCGNEPDAIRCLKAAYELNPGVPGVVTALAQLGALSGEPRR